MEGGKQRPVDRSYEYTDICPAMSATNKGLEELCDPGGSARGPKLKGRPTTLPFVYTVHAFASAYLEPPTPPIPHKL
jgi:hypothetical protein